MSNLAINNRTISESIEDDFRWKLIVDSAKARVYDMIKKVKSSSKAMLGRLSQLLKISQILSEEGVKHLCEAIMKHSERLFTAKARLNSLQRIHRYKTRNRTNCQ